MPGATAAPRSRSACPRRAQGWPRVRAGQMVEPFGHPCGWGDWPVQETVCCAAFSPRCFIIQKVRDSFRPLSRRDTVSPAANCGKVCLLLRGDDSGRCEAPLIGSGVVESLPDGGVFSGFPGAVVGSRGSGDRGDVVRVSVIVLGSVVDVCFAPQLGR